MFSSRLLGSRRAFSSISGQSRLRRPLFWAAGFTVGFGIHAAFSPARYLDAQNVPETIPDPSTGIEFPKTIKIGAKAPIPPLSLVGVGVRTVSFLGIKVYSVGFYADLHNPNLKITAGMTPEEKVSHIIENTHCLLRIVPTRSTSYTHLRDSFVRAMHARMAAAKDTMPDTEALENAIHIGKLKTLFPNSPLKKHAPLDIYLPAPENGKGRVLIFRDLGAIENDWIAYQLVSHYFTESPPSPPMKQSVMKRLESI